MIALINGYRTLVRSTSRFLPGPNAPNRVIRVSFSPHYDEFGADIFLPGGTRVFFAPTLKDGSKFRYTYNPPLTEVLASQRADQCGHAPDIHFSTFYGGEFYNPAIRPYLVDKSPTA